MDMDDNTSYFLHRLESNVFLYTRILVILGISSVGFLLRNVIFYLPHYYIARYYFAIYIIGCIAIFPIRMLVTSLFTKQNYKAVNKLIIISSSGIFLMLVLLSLLDSIRIIVNEPDIDFNFTAYVLGLFIVGFVLRLDWKVSLFIYSTGIIVFIGLYQVFSPRILTVPSVLPFIAMNSLAFYFSCAREKFYLIMHIDKNILLNQTFKDSLTSSFNRRFMKKALHQCFANKRGTEVPFSCVFADIDFFKEINDKYGHDTGDEILYEFSKLLQNESRGMDSVIRYGGEEFLILLPNTRLREAESIADRVRRAIQEIDFTEKKIRITASFGVTEAGNEDNEESIIRRADSLLYKAKREGRNRCCMG